MHSPRYTPLKRAKSLDTPNSHSPCVHLSKSSRALSQSMLKTPEQSKTALNAHSKQDPETPLLQDYSLLSNGEKYGMLPSPITCLEVVDGKYYKPDNMIMHKKPDYNEKSCYGVAVWTCHQDGTISLRQWKNGKVMGSLVTPLYFEDTSGKANNNLEIFTDILHIKETGHVWCATNFGRLLIYDAKFRELVKENTYHKSAINQVLYFNDYVYTASDDKSIAKWHCKQLNLTKVFTGHYDAVKCITAYTGLVKGQIEKSVLISASDDRTIKFWNFDTGQCIHDITLKDRCKITDLCTQGNFLWTASDNAYIYVWNLKSINLEKQLKVHSESITCLESFGSEIWSTSEDKTICIWNAMNFDLIHRISSSHRIPISKIKKIARCDTFRIWTVDDYAVRMWDEQCAFEFNNFFCYENVQLDGSDTPKLKFFETTSEIDNDTSKISFANKKLQEKIIDLEAQLQKTHRLRHQPFSSILEIEAIKNELSKLKEENEYLKKENAALNEKLRVTHATDCRSKLDESESLNILQKAYEILEFQTAKQADMEAHIFTLEQENNKLKNLLKEKSRDSIDEEKVKSYIKSFIIKIQEHYPIDLLKNIDEKINLDEYQELASNYIQQFNKELYKAIGESKALNASLEKQLEDIVCIVKENAKICGEEFLVDGISENESNNQQDENSDEINGNTFKKIKSNEIISMELKATKRSQNPNYSNYRKEYIYKVKHLIELQTHRIKELETAKDQLRLRLKELEEEVYLLKKKNQETLNNSFLGNQALKEQQEQLLNDIKSTIEIIRNIYTTVKDGSQLPECDNICAYALYLQKTIVDLHSESLSKIAEKEKEKEIAEASLNTIQSQIRQLYNMYNPETPLEDECTVFECLSVLREDLNKRDLQLSLLERKDRSFLALERETQQLLSYIENICQVLKKQCEESNGGTEAIPDFIKDIYSEEEWKLITDILADIEANKNVLDDKSTIKGSCKACYYLLKLRVSEACLTMIHLKKANDELLVQLKTISIDTSL